MSDSEKDDVFLKKLDEITKYILEYDKHTEDITFYIRINGAIFSGILCFIGIVIGLVSGYFLFR